MSLEYAGGEHRGSAALADLILRSLQKPLDVPLVLDGDQAAHNDGEEDEPASWAKQTGDERE